MDNQIQKAKNMVHIQFWAARIQECKNSGMSTREWCKVNNICISTYYKNLKIVREYALEQPPVVDESTPALVKVANPLVKKSIPATSAANSIVIHHRDSVIEISNAVSPDLLKVLVQAL